MGFEEFCHRLHARHVRPDRGLVIFHTVPSSHGAAQHVVREYRKEGASAPAADLVAWHQTAGQGRDGRTWSSPPGAGAYVSMIRQDFELVPQSLPMRISVALCRAVGRFVENRCCVRWPNDLLVGEKKIAGILVDLHSQGEDPDIVVVSFGVNHAEDLGAFREPRATSLRAEGGEVALEELVAALIAGVDAALERPEDFAEVRKAYGELSSHSPGDSLRIRGQEEPVEGFFRGFDDKGFLRLEVDGEERLVASGVVGE